MSSDDKVINVREVLQQNSYTTTVDELRNRGKSRVRVINAEQISALIEEAVNRVIATSGGMGRDEVKKIVEKSREEFRRLLAEREKELSEHRDRLRQLDQAREDLAKVTSEAERLKILEAELRRQNETMSAQVADLKIAAKSGGENSEAVRAEVEKLRKNEESSRKEKDSALAQNQELRRIESELRKNEEIGRKEREKLLAQITELNKTIQDLASRKPEPAPAPAPAPVVQQTSPEVMELLKTLGSELASVKAGLKDVATKPVETKSSDSDKVVADKMDEITKTLSSRLDQIGRKVGIGAVDVSDQVQLDNIFNDQESLESNIENVEVKERRGSGIGGAIDRIKALRNKKGGQKDKENKDK